MANAINKITFTIDDHNRIETSVETAEPVCGLPRFATHQELQTLAADWPSSRLLQVWNHIPGNTPVKKFTNRQTAIRRIWNCLESRAMTATTPVVCQSKPRKPKSHPTAVPQAPATKSETVLALLRQPGGASLKALMAATGWQAHSVRGFISGQVTKKMRLKVRSFTRDGQRVYSLRS
jgi:Protein of unknown function (DUF3489)